jgi:S-(hydroxymethyl)glutathione dehydrogenase/alcohol dehydrogenase
VLRQATGRFSVETVYVAEPRFGEALVRLSAAGLCHTDLTYAQGGKPCDLPIVLGHEGAGLVLAIGDGVHRVAVGDHVVCTPNAACGHCQMCASGRRWLCSQQASLQRAEGTEPRVVDADGVEIHQFRQAATFAEMTLMPEAGLVRIDASIPMASACLLACAVVTGAGAVFTGGVQAGSSVAVIGCGGVGLNAIQAAALVGCANIVAVDLSPAKLDAAVVFGATRLVDATKGDPVAAVKAAAGGGVDFAFEAVGRAETVSQAFAMLGPGGTAYILGVGSGDNWIKVPLSSFLLDRSLRGVLGGSCDFMAEVPHLASLYASGSLRLDELVSHCVPLERINEGYEMAAAAHSRRVVLSLDRT